MKNVTLKNEAGLTKELKVGFSWTTFLFGWIVPLFRGQWGEFAKWIFLNPVTLGIWGIVQCWTTNKKTVEQYLEKGYKPSSERDEKLLVSKGIISG